MALFPNDQDGKLYDIVVAPYEQGQKRKGVAAGSTELSNMLQEYLRKTNYMWTIRELRILPQLKNWADDYKMLYDALKEKQSYILLGGDHSIGQSSVAASLYKVLHSTDSTKEPTPNDLGVIWIDAHPDTNTFEASLSKNFHGMPLAGIVGYEKPWFETKATLPTKNLLYFGIRDIDDFENKKITENSVFNTMSCKDLILKVDSMIKENPNIKFHISWDVDSLDPTILDSTGCLAPNGLIPSDIYTIVNYLKGKLIAMDIVEYNPLLGDRAKSASVMSDIFSHIEF